MPGSTTLPPAQFQLSDLIFPEASRNISQTLSQLSSRSLSIRNRLHSIDSDAQFIQDVAVAYPDCAVVANERCGGWYVESGLKGNSFNASGDDDDNDGEKTVRVRVRKKRGEGWGSAYFKSTDGHFGIWNFSLRRLNLGVLDVLGEFGGCIIVDSTRRGKHLPDALSKTIPIWCAVMNLLLFPAAEHAEYHHIVRLPELISESEHAQMEAKLPELVASAKTLDLPISALRQTLQHKPLRPTFIARSLNLHPLPAHAGAASQTPVHSLPYHPLYLTMASTYQPNSHEENTSGYVQGAGDDNEMWSQGLTSAMWWQNRAAFLAASEEELPGLIARITIKAAEESSAARFVPISAAMGKVVIGGLPIAQDAEEEILSRGSEVLLIICCPSSQDAERMMSQKLRLALGKRLLHLRCGVGKVGSRDLRKELKRLPDFIASNIPPASTTAPKATNGHTAEAEQEDAQIATTPKLASVLIADTEGGLDIAAGVALALLALYTNNSGEVDWSTAKECRFMDKATTTKKLSWITTAMPAAKPSGTTLKAVNEFLFRR